MKAALVWIHHKTCRPWMIRALKVTEGVTFGAFVIVWVASLWR